MKHKPAVVIDIQAPPGTFPPSPPSLPLSLPRFLYQRPPSLPPSLPPFLPPSLPPLGTFDVNVTPDKREIFLTHEALLLTKLKEKLQSMWGVHDQERTFQVGREGGREGGR